MANRTHRSPLVLSETQRRLLLELSRSTTAPRQRVKRSKVLLKYAEGSSLSDIRRQLGLSYPTVYKYIDSALKWGVETQLNYTPATKKPEILDDAKDWVIRLANASPLDFGLAASRWSLRLLARHISENAVGAGFPRLATASQTTVWRILKKREPAEDMPVKAVLGYRRATAPVGAESRFGARNAAAGL